MKIQIPHQSPLHTQSKFARQRKQCAKPTWRKILCQASRPHTKYEDQQGQWKFVYWVFDPRGHLKNSRSSSCQGETNAEHKLYGPGPLLSLFIFIVLAHLWAGILVFFVYFEFLGFFWNLCKGREGWRLFGHLKKKYTTYLEEVGFLLQQICLGQSKCIIMLMRIYI